MGRKCIAIWVILDEQVNDRKIDEVPGVHQALILSVAFIVTGKIKRDMFCLPCQHSRFDVLSPYFAIAARYTGTLVCR